MHLVGHLRIGLFCVGCLYRQTIVSEANALCKDDGIFNTTVLRQPTQLSTLLSEDFLTRFFWLSDTLLFLLRILF